MEASDQTPDQPGEQQEQPTLQDVINKAVADALAQANVADALAQANASDSTPKIAVPKVDHAPQTPEEVQELGRMFAEYRAEVAALRQELQAHRPRTITVAAPSETPEQRQDRRLAAIAEHSHYCPACGRLSKYPRECVGTIAGPHAAIEMVPTDELGGDPAKHTRAPSTDTDQPDLIAA